MTKKHAKLLSVQELCALHLIVCYMYHKCIKHYSIVSFLNLRAGTDPGFLDRDFKFTKGGSICLFYLIIY